jgi:hypothetical protein
MQWPKELLDVFARALQIEPIAGMDKMGVIRAMLDETARRTVVRAQADPANVSYALRTPYTPLGSVVGDGVNGMALRLGLGGAAWGEAVDALYEYVEAHAQEVCTAFKDVPGPPVEPPMW